MFKAKFLICSLYVARKSQKFSRFSVVVIVVVVVVVVVADVVDVEAQRMGINLASGSVA
jgi:hypothetical protein